MRDSDRNTAATLKYRRDVAAAIESYRKDLKEIIRHNPKDFQTNLFVRAAFRIAWNALQADWRRADRELNAARA
jgi:hypothetical protein